MADNPRIEELRRRVQLDPASIAFAALAEEYRRAGQFQEAIAACKAGLRRHPAYLSAHVTLGRALIEVGEYEEAREELEHVLKVAPENLAAIRGLADIHHRLGDTDVGVAQRSEQAGPALRAATVPPTPSAPVPIALSTPVESAPEPPTPSSAEAPQIATPPPVSNATPPPSTFEPPAASEPAATIPLARTAPIAAEPASWEIPLPASEATPPETVFGLTAPVVEPDLWPAPAESAFEPTATVTPEPEPMPAASMFDLSPSAVASIPEPPQADPALPGLEAFLAAILRAREDLDSADSSRRT